MTFLGLGLEAEEAEVADVVDALVIRLGSIGKIAVDLLESNRRLLQIQIFNKPSTAVVLFLAQRKIQARPVDHRWSRSSRGCGGNFSVAAAWRPPLRF